MGRQIRGATSRKRARTDQSISRSPHAPVTLAARILAGRDEARAPFSSTTSATPIRRYAQATLTLNRKQHRLDDAPASNTNTNTNTKQNDEAHGRCSRAPCGRRLVRRHGRRKGSLLPWLKGAGKMRQLRHEALGHEMRGYGFREVRGLRRSIVRTACTTRAHPRQPHSCSAYSFGEGG